MKTTIPKYMDQGSYGVHVTILQAFLIGAGYGEGLEFDNRYAKVTGERVSDLQRNLGIGVDGNFGPQTREKVKERMRFDFEAACCSVPGTTKFMHGDQDIVWTCEGVVEAETETE